MSSSSFASDSYILPSNSDSHDAHSNSGSDVDSLPSSLDSSDLDSVSNSDAQREWEASLEQLELVLTMVIVPYAGKYFGRKFAYWSWAKFMTWKYPVEVRFTNKTSFNVAGAVEAAATL